MYADPTKVHKIHHESKRYKVEGPHLVAPSPQRTPVLFQAGSSTAGRDFASRNAEAVFIIAPNPESARKVISETRQLAMENGRNPDDIKFFQGLSFVVGDTEEEVIQKSADLDKKIDLDMMVAHISNSFGKDLGNLPLDTPLEEVQTESVRSIAEWVRQSTPGRLPTIADLARFHSKLTRIEGTPDTIADELARWSEAGVDGINVINATIPGSYEEFIDHVLPVLRKRGLARQNNKSTGTLRNRLFGENRLNERHAAAKYRGAFSKTPASKS